MHKYQDEQQAQGAARAMGTVEREPAKSTMKGAGQAGKVADLTMTIREERAVQQILKQTQSVRQTHQAQTDLQHAFDYGGLASAYELDQQIRQIIEESERHISSQYDCLAHEQLLKNRMSVTLADDEDLLQRIFQRMDHSSSLSNSNNQEGQYYSLIEGSRMFLRQRRQSTHSRGQGELVSDLQLNRSLGQDQYLGAVQNQDSNSLDSSSSDEQEQIPKPAQNGDYRQKTASAPSRLDKFQKQFILKPKKQALQILQLDQKYPKINIMTMHRQQFPIFDFRPSPVWKYVRFLKKKSSEVNCAVSFQASDNSTWTILAIEYLLYIFITDEWKEPVVVSPQKSSSKQNRQISCLALSPLRNYLAVGLGSEVVLYKIKSQARNLVLVKNMSGAENLHTPIQEARAIRFYHQEPLKLAYLDSLSRWGTICVEQNMIYTNVVQKALTDGFLAADLDVLCVMEAQQQSNTEGRGLRAAFNQKLNSLIAKSQKTLLAAVSSCQIRVYKTEPNYQMFWHQPLLEQPSTGPSVRWRVQSDIKSRPQLLVCFNNKVHIYKLMQGQDPEASHLQLHLLFQNHYSIQQMHVISNTHLLLLSNQNIIVVAVPLIPTTDLSQVQSPQLGLRPRKASGCGHEAFQSAIVFVSSESSCRILFVGPDQIIYHTRDDQGIKTARLRTLEEHLEQLILRKGNFRDAFTLIILVFKQLNYSFKFSYKFEALTQCIFAAVESTVASLTSSVQQTVTQFRLGWVCQLLFQTRNEQMIWSTLYGRLLDKQKDRQRQAKIAQAKCKDHEENDREGTSYNLGQNQLEKTIYDEILSIKHSSVRRAESLKPQNSIGPKGIVTHQSSLQLELNILQEPNNQDKTLEQMLFDILEVFVLKSQVSLMPEDVFLRFVEYECSKRAETIVEKLIVQNKRCSDGAKMLQILNIKQMFYLLFFLFSNGIISEEPDFYTPFVKVFFSFRKYADSSKQPKQDKMSYLGNICLWYLRKCLSFEKIPEGSMTLNQKTNVVASLCLQVIEPSIASKLFQFDAKTYLQILLLLFAQTQLSLMVDEQNDSLLETYKQLHPATYQQIVAAQSLSHTLSRSSFDEVPNLSIKQMILLHLPITVPALKTQKLVWAQFLALCFFLGQPSLSLPYETVLDALIVLFQGKLQAFSLNLPARHQIPTAELVKMFLIQYIQPILVQRKDRINLNKLISFGDSHVAYHLHRLDHNYRLALDNFMTSKPTAQLFGFVRELILDIKSHQGEGPEGSAGKGVREKKLNEVKQFLVKNIGQLFRIDHNEALNTFYEVGETTQSIYNLIDENMGDKLDFLSAVLKKFNEQDFHSKQKFQLEHLSQVCRLKDKKMLQYLNSFQYPLDQGIIVCEQRGNLLAKAILEERCGRLSDAFLSYQRLLRNMTNASQSKRVRSEKKTKLRVRKYTEECIRLCKCSSYDCNSSPEHNFWLRIITFINGFIRSNNQQKVFLKVEFEKVLQRILRQMFQFLPTSVLIDFFITRGHRLELSLAKEFSIYQNLFALAKFDIRMANQVIEIFRVDIKDSRKQALSSRKNAIKSFGVCDFCKKQLTEDTRSSLYACKHSFHKLCHDDVHRCLTCYFESANSILSSNIFGTELSKIYENCDLFPHEKQPKGREMARLKEMRNIQIVVQDSWGLQQEAIKKRLKLFDFGSEKQSQKLYQGIQYYSQKQLESLQDSLSFEDENISFTREKGLVIKSKVQDAGQDRKIQV